MGIEVKEDITSRTHPNICKDHSGAVSAASLNCMGGESEVSKA